jgi:hypothetical protein
MRRLPAPLYALRQLLQKGVYFTAIISRRIMGGAKAGKWTTNTRHVHIQERTLYIRPTVQQFPYWQFGNRISVASFHSRLAAHIFMDSIMTVEYIQSLL